MCAEQILVLLRAEPCALRGEPERAPSRCRALPRRTPPRPLPVSADEKYNFERLQASTVLNKQPLLAPQPLDLSPTEELTIR